MAGPGHKPPSPHPNPKITAPITNFLSIILLAGKAILSAKTGFYSLWIMK